MILAVAGSLVVDSDCGLDLQKVWALGRPSPSGLSVVWRSVGAPEHKTSVGRVGPLIPCTHPMRVLLRETCWVRRRMFWVYVNH